MKFLSALLVAAMLLGVIFIFGCTEKKEPPTQPLPGNGTIGGDDEMPPPPPGGFGTNGATSGGSGTLPAGSDGNDLPPPPPSN